jgi:hypothetical protein
MPMALMTEPLARIVAQSSPKIVSEKYSAGPKEPSANCPLVREVAVYDHWPCSEPL